MKKINSNGFVMVETIIVAVFVIGVCAFLFSNFLPLIGDYERVSQYDTLESKYKNHEIRKMLLREIKRDNSLVTSLFETVNNTNKYNKYSSYESEISDRMVIKNELCDKIGATYSYGTHNYCNKLLGPDHLNVKEIYITKFKLTGMKTAVKSLDGQRALKEYVEYLPSYSKYSSRYDNYYRLIVVYNDGTMSNIEVHYEIG